MIYQEHKAPDGNWCRLVHPNLPDGIACSKYALKDKRTIGKVRRMGSPKVVAFTRGIYEAEDTVIEMDRMIFYTRFLPALGATAANKRITGMVGKIFELIEYVADPDKGVGGAGGTTNIAKGCEAIGIESSVEMTETPTTVSFSVAIKEIVWGAGPGGGLSIAQ